MSKSNKKSNKYSKEAKMYRITIFEDNKWEHYQFSDSLGKAKSILNTLNHSGFIARMEAG